MMNNSGVSASDIFLPEKGVKALKTNIFLRFRDDEKGSATIESLLWMPLFFYLFILITDVSFVFFGKAQALRIIQDGNRAFSVGIDAYDDETKASAEIRNRLRTISPSAEASTDLVDGIITTTGTLSMREMMAVGSIPEFATGEISVIAQHYKEN